MGEIRQIIYLIISEILEIKYLILEKKIQNRFHRVAVDIKNVLCNYNSVKTIVPLSFNDEFTYKDETWNYIKELHHLFLRKAIGLAKSIENNSCTNSKVFVIGDNKLQFVSRGISDDWIYCIYNKSISNKSVLEFDCVINSIFTEFQIAFNHESIFERYRFRVVDNKELVFEVISGGFFFNDIYSVEFSFELQRQYNIKVVLNENQYSFVVDGEVVLCVEENRVIDGELGFALILWDNNKESNIDVCFKNMKLLS